MFDVIVIGGGIIGLTSALVISDKYKNQSVAILESNDFLGEGNTSRNSGVLHAGLYYKKNSKKHKFCIEGNRIWREWAGTKGMPINVCGKYLIASSKQEVPQLERLFQNAISNGVENINWCSTKEINDYVKSEKAFFSQTTGIIDVPIALKKIELELIQKKVMIQLRCKAKNIVKTTNGFEIETSQGKIETKVIVNAAGFGAISLRKKIGLLEFENMYVKGNYVKLKKKYFNASLIYPVPPDGLKGLGVHTSIDPEGKIRFGPDAEDIEEYNYKLSEGVVDSMWPAINSLFKGIQIEDLMIDFAGVRTKLLKDTYLFDDFVIQRPIHNYIEALGIESPGLTASPAIAQEIARLIEL